MVSVGDIAPEFELPGTDGKEIETYALSDFIEDGMVVLTFYPFDFSPTCTDQLCEFRDAEFLTFTEGIDVLGISVDSAYAHRAFIQEYDLTFPLVSDRMAGIAEQYNLKKPEVAGHPEVCQRGLVAIDSDRTVRYVWRPGNDEVAPTATNLEEAIDWYRETSD